MKLKFEETGSGQDISNAVASFEKSTTLARQTTDIRFELHFQLLLGLSLEARYRTAGNERDLQAAIKCYQAVAVSTAARPFLRVSAAHLGGVLAYSSDIHEACRLLKLAVELLPMISPSTVSRFDKQYGIAHFEEITSDAAAVSLLCTSDPYEAIQLLETGRNLHTSLSEVSWPSWRKSIAY